MTATPTTVADLTVVGEGPAGADTLNVLATPQIQPSLNTFSEGSFFFSFQGPRTIGFAGIEHLLVNGQPAAASFQFGTAAVTRDEGAGSAILTVVRTGNPFANATVGFATANGSATGGQDYTAHFGNLVFASGETSKTITIPLTPDQADEQDEILTVTLSNSTDTITLGAISTATVVIRDDDLPAAAGCNPRPKVNVATVTDGPGKLKVTLTAESLPTIPNNKLQSPQFQTGANAVVDVAGQTGKPGASTSR